MATQIAPTKGNLIATKKSYDLAKLGFELLDRKRNILIREMMALIDRAEEIQSKIDTAYTKAFSTLKKANIALGVCEQLAQVIPEEKGINISFRSVMGVEIPIIQFKENKIKNIPFGLYDSNSDLDKAYSCFREVRTLTANLAEVETSVYLLARDIKKTQKRANALKNIMIPRFENMIKSISDALEEKEREEFSRLKVIKRVKNKAP
ncbi:MAG: V-type ATP synthase subunit D [Clostridia bacterium]|nr:V-type ATP synthase subunit D [Clostridia bacterium]